MVTAERSRRYRTSRDARNDARLWNGGYSRALIATESDCGRQAGLHTHGREQGLERAAGDASAWGAQRRVTCRHRTRPGARLAFDWGDNRRADFFLAGRGSASDPGDRNP